MGCELKVLQTCQILNCYIRSLLVDAVHDNLEIASNCTEIYNKINLAVLL